MSSPSPHPSTEGTIWHDCHTGEHTAWPGTFLPESISTHYIKQLQTAHISQSLRVTVTGRRTRSFVLQLWRQRPCSVWLPAWFTPLSLRVCGPTCCTQQLLIPALVPPVDSVTHEFDIRLDLTELESKAFIFVLSRYILSTLGSDANAHWSVGVTAALFGWQICDYKQL